MPQCIHGVAGCIPRHRSAGGVQTLFENNLVYYDNQEASGAAISTSSPGTYNMSEQNTVGQIAGLGAGQYGRELIVGNDEILTLLATDGALDLVPGLGDYTIAMWIRPDAGISAGTAYMLGTYAADPNGGVGLQHAGGDSGRLIAFVDDNTGHSDNCQTIGSEIGDLREAWHLVIISLNRATGIGLITIDNVLNAFFAPPADLNISAIEDVQMGPTRYLALGTDGWLPAATYWGGIGPWGIWGKVTSVGENTFLWNTGSAFKMFADFGGYVE